MTVLGGWGMVPWGFWYVAHLHSSILVLATLVAPRNEEHCIW